MIVPFALAKGSGPGAGRGFALAVLALAWASMRNAATSDMPAATAVPVPLWMGTFRGNRLDVIEQIPPAGL